MSDPLRACRQIADLTMGIARPLLVATSTVVLGLSQQPSPTPSPAKVAPAAGAAATAPWSSFDWVEDKTATARPGLHFAGVRGRAMAKDDAPLAGGFVHVIDLQRWY